MRVIIVALISFVFLMSSFINDTPKKNRTENIPTEKSPSDTFPQPNTKNMLFFVQRNHNINTIVYDLNYMADSSTINEEIPIHPYWIRYADHGEKLELNYIQRNFAYGVHAKMVDKTNKSYRIHLSAYDKREIFLRKSAVDHKYHAYLYINGKISILHCIYIHIEGGTFWFPHVAYIDLKGKDVITGTSVFERFVPEQKQPPK